MDLHLEKMEYLIKLTIEFCHTVEICSFCSICGSDRDVLYTLMKAYVVRCAAILLSY